MGITHLCENAHFTYKSFNIPVSFALVTLAHMINVYEICLNTTNSDIQYARFQILSMDVHFGLFWSASIPTMLKDGPNYSTTDVLHNPRYWNVSAIKYLKNNNNIIIRQFLLNYKVCTTGFPLFISHKIPGYLQVLSRWRWQFWHQRTDAKGIIKLQKNKTWKKMSQYNIEML